MAEQDADGDREVMAVRFKLLLERLADAQALTLQILRSLDEGEPTP